MPPAKPPEFRRRAIALARAGDQSIARTAADLGIAESCCGAGSSRSLARTHLPDRDRALAEMSSSHLHRRLTTDLLGDDRRTGIARRIAQCLTCSCLSDHVSSLVGRLARLGWTRIGSPGIFG